VNRRPWWGWLVCAVRGHKRKREVVRTALGRGEPRMARLRCQRCITLDLWDDMTDAERAKGGG
jgi:hypothetical protein